ncbi:MAG: hypothetical protein ACLFRY_03635 [Spirochaetia bacterium]
MKRKILYGLLILGVFGSLLLSCDLLSGPVAASERIDLFMADLNAGNYSKLYTHFMEGQTTQYNTIKDPVWWDSHRLFSSGNKPPGGFTLTTDTATDQGSYLSIPGNFTNVNDTYSVTFNMMEAADGSYYIYQLIDEDEDVYSIKIISLAD